MKASQVIAKLANLIREFGDQDVAVAVSNRLGENEGAAKSVAREIVTLGENFTIYAE